MTNNLLNQIISLVGILQIASSILNRCQIVLSFVSKIISSTLIKWCPLKYHFKKGDKLWKNFKKIIVETRSWKKKVVNTKVKSKDKVTTTPATGLLKPKAKKVLQKNNRWLILFKKLVVVWKNKSSKTKTPSLLSVILNKVNPLLVLDKISHKPNPKTKVKQKGFKMLEE